MSSPINTERVTTFPNAILESTRFEMARDPSVILMGLGITDHIGILGTTKGLVDEFGPDRVIETPLSEDSVTGVAVGAAMAGLRPIHVHIRMDFLMLCMNQLVNMAAKAHYMYGGTVRVPMVVRAVIGKSWGQGAQHSQGLHALFMHVPGIKVVAPSNAHDAKGCLAAAVRDNNPVLFVEHRLLYRTETAVPSADYCVAAGRARVCRRGSDVTLVGVSVMLLECLRAAELLEDAGISAEVIDPIWLAPLDSATIVESAGRTGRLVVVDTGWTSCGASAEIVARTVETAMGERAIRVRRMGYAAASCPPTPVLEDLYYPNPARIAEAAYALVRPEGPVWHAAADKAEMAYAQGFRGPF